MVNADMLDPETVTKAMTDLSLRCRQIEDSDIPAIVDLLARGFGPRRTRRFWHDVLERLRNRSNPAGRPRYGYLLESGQRPVGAILLIFSQMRDGAGEAPRTRCNVSSWYVEPQFRGYASFLVAHALKQKDVTFLNISAVPQTLPILQVQGYVRYSRGICIAMAALSRNPAEEYARVIAADARPAAPFDAADRELLLEHAGFGCISLWVETPERAYPFVFRPRLAKRLLPCAQLVYCRDMADFVRFARPLGRHLASRGRPFVILDANGPIPGLVGRYFEGTMARYFKGAAPPRQGDLAYTEAALFGM
jgi:hypothetical protein